MWMLLVVGNAVVIVILQSFPGCCIFYLLEVATRTTLIYKVNVFQHNHSPFGGWGIGVQCVVVSVAGALKRQSNHTPFE